MVHLKSLTMVAWMETKVPLVGALGRIARQNSLCGTFFFPNNNWPKLPSASHCLLRRWPLGSATPALEASDANLHRKMAPAGASWQQIHPKRYFSLHFTMEADQTQPNPMPSPCLNWLRLLPSAGRWCWCEEEQEVPCVAEWRGRFLGKHPVSFSKGTCAALNSLGVWVHPQLGTNQHSCL